MFWVVIDDRGEPVGVLHERAIRRYVFSPYGWALLAGGEPEALAPYISKCPVADIHTPVERLADMFAFGDHSEEGVILTDNGIYAGFVRAAEILKAMHERDVELARDQNPLTGLPGNNRIGEYIRESLADERRGFGFIYFDFDHFKAFNDTYGFRRGDRAIRLFAGIEIPHHGFDELVMRVSDIMDRFRFDAMSLREADEAARGLRATHDRIAAHSEPALGVSAALVHVPQGRSGVSADGLGALIATLKSSAKRSPTHIATLDYDGTADEVFPDQRQAEMGAPVR